MAEINTTFLMIQLLNIALLIGILFLWGVTFVRAFRRLRQEQMSEGVRLIWVIIIISIPILGAAAFLILHPQGKSKHEPA